MVSFRIAGTAGWQCRHHRVLVQHGRVCASPGCGSVQTCGHSADTGTPSPCCGTFWSRCRRGPVHVVACASPDASACFSCAQTSGRNQRTCTASQPPHPNPISSPRAFACASGGWSNAASQSHRSCTQIGYRACVWLSATSTPSTLCTVCRSVHTGTASHRCGNDGVPQGDWNDGISFHSTCKRTASPTSGWGCGSSAYSRW